ncbi:MAG TPA: protein-L-isoaspartate O-methyltransferase [Candidatus Glassbacteria bacterium]|nr:protein-L-isoaspartate O-methyltransferase [Candidatus Glassbacteria bacterium]
MVSIINEALELEIGHKVLEVGAGSGWHSATIAEIIAPSSTPRSEWGSIFTLEIIRNLAENARKNILNSKYADRIKIINTDGSKGYLEKAPYDRVLVNAAAPAIPPPLIDQLKTGGILIIPIGNVSLFQNLIKISKDFNGQIKKENLGGVAFVPLTGNFGQ